MAKMSRGVFMQRRQRPLAAAAAALGGSGDWLYQAARGHQRTGRRSMDEDGQIGRLW